MLEESVNLTNVLSNLKQGVKEKNRRLSRQLYALDARHRELQLVDEMLASILFNCPISQSCDGRTCMVQFSFVIDCEYGATRHLHSNVPFSFTRVLAEELVQEYKTMHQDEQKNDPWMEPNQEIRPWRPDAKVVSFDKVQREKCNRCNDEHDLLLIVGLHTQMRPDHPDIHKSTLYRVCLEAARIWEIAI